MQDGKSDTTMDKEERDSLKKKTAAEHEKKLDLTSKLLRALKSEFYQLGFPAFQFTTIGQKSTGLFQLMSKFMTLELILMPRFESNSSRLTFSDI